MSVFLIFPISKLLKTLHPFRRDLHWISLIFIRCMISSQSNAELHFDNFYTLVPSIFSFALCLSQAHPGGLSSYWEEVKNLSELTCTCYWLHCSAGCITGCWHGYLHDMSVGLAGWRISLGFSLASLAYLIHSVVWRRSSVGTNLRPCSWSLPIKLLIRFLLKLAVLTIHSSRRRKFDNRSLGKCKVCFCLLVTLNLWSVFTRGFWDLS